MSYVDIHCDATLDSSNLKKVVWPTSAEHKNYQHLLAFLAKLVPVTKLYKSHQSPPDTLMTMLSDFELERRNSALLAKMMAHLNNSDIKDINNNGYQVHFVGDAMEMTFAVAQGEGKSASCIVAERVGSSYIVLHDDGCTGSVSSLESSEQKEPIPNFYLIPIFYDMLQGLERFTNPGRETFPKR